MDAGGRDAVGNIGPRERAKRRFMGLVGLAAAVAWGFACILQQTPRSSRLLVFVFAWLGALGLLQAKEKT